MTESEKLDLILEKVSKIDKLESDLQELKQKVEKLAIGQSEIKKEMYSLDRRIADTYKVALDAWGQGMETKTWLESNTLQV